MDVIYLLVCTLDLDEGIFTYAFDSPQKAAKELFERVDTYENVTLIAETDPGIGRTLSWDQLLGWDGSYEVCAWIEGRVCWSLRKLQVQ